MGGKGKDAAQRFLAIIVIIAMMSAMGIPPPVIIFFAIVIYFVWRAVQHTERQETNRVFDFYVAASDILRDEERRWYGFEIAHVTNEGERILREMIDAPPLVLYALGALYHRAGDYASAGEHLGQLIENEAGDESRRLVASPELKRYVETLRRLERDPAEKPQTMAAVRSLERARRAYAHRMLDETRTRLTTALEAPRHHHHNSTPAPQLTKDIETPSLLTYIAAASDKADHASEHAHGESAAHLAHTAIKANLRDEHAAVFERPPASGEQRSSITEVLRDVYEEEKKRA